MRLIAWSLAGLLVVALTACGSAGNRNALSRDAWDPLRVHGSEVESYDTVEDMADAADVVVVGTVAGTAPGRSITLSDDPAAGSAQMLDVTVDVSEVLSGELPDEEELVVEFFVPPTAGELPDPEDLEELTHTGDVVFFLRDKGSGASGNQPLPEEEGLLRVVNSYGLVTETAEMPVDVPLAEVPEPEELEAEDLEALEDEDLEALESVAEEPIEDDPEELEEQLDNMGELLEWDDLDDFTTDVRNHLQET